MQLTTAFSRAAAVCVAAVAFSLAAAAPSQAEDRRVRIVNATSYTMVQFFASSIASKSWEEDILGVDVLYSGNSVMIDIDDGSNACLYDFKAVFDDGDEVLDEGIDVCTVGEYTFYE